MSRKYGFSNVLGATKKREFVVDDRKFESLESLARAFGMSRNTVDYRISKGWTPKQAIGLEPRPAHAARTPGIPVYVQGREFKNIKEAAKHYSRAYTHVIEMLKKGRSIEQSLGLTKRADTLHSENPELAKQWHPCKNGILTPNDVSSGSGRRVWWLCSRNHEWEAVINSRNGGIGCPYCAGQRPTAERNFASEYPELLRTWDWKKNKDLDPKTLTPRANHKVWWMCEKGHSWQATITNKTRKGYKGECPYCLNRKLCNDNSLAHLRPDIAQDWHPTKNHDLTPNNVIAGGSKKIWWMCKHGHEWKAMVGTRVHGGTGCPQCALQTSRIEIAVYSELRALFSSVSWREKIEGYECDILLKEKNIGIEIDGVHWHKRRAEVDKVKQNLFDRRGIQLFRLRESGLEQLSERDISFKWSANVFRIISQLVKQILKYAQLNEEERIKLEDYVHGERLVNEKLYREIVSQLPAPPLELSLAVKNPEIAKEWAHDLNAPLSPEHFRPASNKNVWWRCSQGHVWETSLNNRASQNTGCPTCPRSVSVTVTEEWNFAAIHPDLAKEWNYKRNGNLIPRNIRPKSNKKVWWKCCEGHEWQATPSSRSSGSGCPFCYGRFASETNNFARKYPELLKEWDRELNKGLNPSDFTPHVNKKVWWQCGNGHSWQAAISNRTRNRSGCPACAQENSRKYTISYFHAYAIERGGNCLTEEYFHGKTRITMVCKEGHSWSTRAEKFQYYNKWCSVCASSAFRGRF